MQVRPVYVDDEYRDTSGRRPKGRELPLEGKLSALRRGDHLDVVRAERSAPEHHMGLPGSQVTDDQVGVFEIHPWPSESTPGHDPSIWCRRRGGRPA